VRLAWICRLYGHLMRCTADVLLKLDVVQDMIARARKNASNKCLSPPQVAFVQCLLTEALPIRSETIDCILSNCVVNLLPLSGKAALLRETFRVLKAGGRIVLDDVGAHSYTLNCDCLYCYSPDRRKEATPK
jgi:ubiquinone/menaquinone biosynthesis C-methylase UbiE